MKISIPCITCMNRKLNGRRLYRHLVNETSVYRVTCDEGHKTTTILTNPRFEILIEIALEAIVDGYFREAVTSFHSALEAWRLFYIKVVLNRASLSAGIEASFKKLGNHSERQLGAYVLARTLEVGEPPKLLPSSKVKFRNNVVHGGTIPTRVEAENFGKAVWASIVPDLTLLQKAISAEQNDAVSRTLAQVRDRALQSIEPLERFKRGSVLTMRLTAGLCLKRGEPVKTFDEALGIQMRS